MTQTFAYTSIYKHTQAGMLSPTVQNALHRVYVPNGDDGTVSVIDPTTYKIIDTLRAGNEPQHIVPSYDLQTLWVLNNQGNSVTPIDPTTAKTGAPIAVDDPYNLYFTPDGKSAIVVCEGRQRLEFHDPKTMKLQSMLPVQCRGANHMEFTIDNQYAIITCEYSGQLAKIDIKNQKVLGTLSFMKTPTPIPTAIQETFTIQADGKIICGSDQSAGNTKSMPQDIRSSADGKIFYVADMMQDGIHIIDPVTFKKIGFIRAGVGTHAIYPSRNGKLFYISNRGCHNLRCGPHGNGSISVLDPEKKAIIATWAIPNGGSPDMGNVTADGRELWLSGRYDSEVYVFDTEKGILSHRIPVGKNPHGLTVWPQPGRYSLGHTGNMR